VKRKEVKGKTLSLFADDPLMGQYRFAALVTDLTLPTQEVWRLYRGRADCENRIKELKYDFAADSFCLHDFWATEAALSMVMVAYNLMSLFRQATLRASMIQSGGRNVQHTLKTLCATSYSPRPASSPRRAERAYSSSLSPCISDSGWRAFGIAPKPLIFRLLSLPFLTLEKF
jgi:hypothetical protein